MRTGMLGKRCVVDSKRKILHVNLDSKVTNFEESPKGDVELILGLPRDVRVYWKNLIMVEWRG